MQSLRNMTFIISAAMIVLNGCASNTTFNNYARGGDTVAVAVPWNPEFDVDNIKVTVNDFVNPPTVYTAPDPAIRGSVNFYPDPVSSLILSERTQSNITLGAQTYANLINTESTDTGVNDDTVDDTDLDGVQGDGDGEWDRDWWQTVVFVDLPTGMSTGDADITIEEKMSPFTQYATSTVNIVPGTGVPNEFVAKLGLFAPVLDSAHFAAMARADHYVIEFSGTTVPGAIQVDLTHDSGTGTPYVVNPNGIKSLSWSQTGTSGTDLRVILMPSRDGEITNMTDFKFYVAGGIANLAISGGSLQAFDSNGDPVTGVSASITARN